MRSFPIGSATIAAGVLALGAFLAVKQPERLAATEAAEPVAPKLVSLRQAYESTAIGLVIKANDGRVPRNGAELVKALAEVGDFAQLPVPFSAVALDSGLTHPRVLIAPRPGRGHPDASDAPQLDVGLIPLDFERGPMVRTEPPRKLLSPAKVTQPHVEGRLFFAANMARTGDTIKVRTIEFISWNSKRSRFDFGVIDCTEAEPTIQLLDGVRCFSCHKNQGPILGQGPWSNTTHNTQVRTAALAALLAKKQVPAPMPSDAGEVPLRLDGLAGFGRVRQKALPFSDKTTFDGISLVMGEPEICDASIRIGGELARDRDVYRAMTKSTDGRKALVVLLSAIASPQSLAETQVAVKQAVDLAFNVTSSNFADDFVSISKSSSSMLADFNPSGSMGVLRSTVTNQSTGWGGGSTQRVDTRLVFSGDPKKVTEYDQKRSKGDHGMPSAHQPSNPRAFVRTPVPVPPKPSAVVNATDLARVIGISQGDREFFAKSIADAVQAIDKPKVTAATLARDVFNDPIFMDTLKAGRVPDREEFKDRFVDALTAVAKVQKAELPAVARADYASGPSYAPAAGRDERDALVVPTTACMRCHDVRGAKATPFNPIPMLAFDPFDKPARDKWANDTSVKVRAEVLTRLKKRLSTDRDMPPEDSAEYERFRQKDVAGFDAVKDWVEMELQKAKGN